MEFHLSEFLNGLRIELADGLEESIVETYFTHLATSSELTYADRVRGIRDFRVRRNQQMLCKQCLQRDIAKAQSTDSSLEWHLAVISNLIESSGLLPTVEIGAVLSDIELWMVEHVFSKADFPGIEVRDSTVYFSPTHESTNFAVYLFQVGAINLTLGLPVSAAGLLSIASRLVIQEPDALPLLASIYSHISVSLTRLEQYERAKQYSLNALFIVSNEDLSEPELPHFKEQFIVSLLFLGIQAIALFDEGLMPAFLQARERLKDCEPENDASLFWLRLVAELNSAQAHFFDGDVANMKVAIRDADVILENLPESFRQLSMPERLMLSRMKLLFAHTVNDRGLISTVLHDVDNIETKDLVEVRNDVKLEFLRLSALKIAFEHGAASRYESLHLDDLPHEAHRSRTFRSSVDSDWESVVQEFRRMEHPERPHIKYQLAQYVCAWAGALMSSRTGETENAKKALDKLNDALGRLSDAENTPFAYLLITTHALIASAQRELGSLELSRQHSDRAIELSVHCRKDHDDVPSIVIPLAQSLTVSGLTYLELGKLSVAAERLDEAETLLYSEFLKNRRNLDHMRISVIAMSSTFLGTYRTMHWARQASKRMQVLLATIEPDGMMGPGAFRMAHLFYSNWIIACYETDPNELPIALSSMQGRNYAIRLGMSIGSKEGNKDTTLKHLRRRIKLTHDKRKEEFGEWLRKSVTERHDQDARIREENKEADTRYQKYQDEMIDDLIEYRKLVAHVNTQPLELGCIGYSGEEITLIDLDTARRKLVESEMLVCLIDVLCGDYVRSKRFARQFAWVCTSTGKVSMLELDVADLLENDISERAEEDGEQHTRRFRRNTTHASGRKTITLEKYQALMKDRVLSIVPPNVQTVHVVSYGRFHRMSLENVAPNIHWCFYPSLHFFSDERETAVDSETFVNISSANPDLVFASQEQVLLNQVWKRFRPNANLLAFDQIEECKEIPSCARLHIAGHGRIGGKKELRAEIETGNGRCVSEVEVQRFGICAKVVWLSTCLVGHSREDEEGDPAGLAVPFLLNGSEAVVACLTAIPDNWMPLFVGLVEWSMFYKGHSITDAVRMVKSHLNDWPTVEGFHEFETVYRPWLLSVWRRVISDYWIEGDFDALAIGRRETVAAFVTFVEDKLFWHYGLDARQWGLLGETTSLEWDVNVIQIRVADVIARNCLVPPMNVCSLFRYSVKVFVGSKHS